MRRGRRAVWVHSVRKGRVQAVAVATKALARRPKALRRAMRRVIRAKATQARPRFEPNAAQAAAAAAGRVTGRTLAGTRNAQLDRALALLCSLQVQAPR